MLRKKPAKEVTELIQQQLMQEKFVETLISGRLVWTQDRRLAYGSHLQ